MASAILAQTPQALGSAQRKRDSKHLGQPSPSKRLMTASTTGMTRAAFPSPSPMADHTRGLKAEKWYNDTNSNASRIAPFLDNDPPFYIKRPPSSDGKSACAVHSDGSSVRKSVLGNPTAPTRSLLAHMELSEGNSEDFRSVIDDLTIENKKLKKKLKQYERLHCSHLQEDKLFEIRVHGLAAHRKRELEHTLRSFASSIDLSPEASAPNLVPTRRATSNSGPSTNLQAAAVASSPSTFPLAESVAASRKASSASTTCSKPIDSAYASMSDPAWTSRLQLQDKGRFDRLSPAWQTQRSVASYLQDIPETLMPQHTMVMSGRARSKLVVRRLEQIFTGKGAASRCHTQSHQQQEVSQSAARADRSRLDAQGRGHGSAKEGVREARILPDNACLQVESLIEADAAIRKAKQGGCGGRDSSCAPQSSRNQSPDQRPTRPLDLDLHRAQIPAENIDYIRHLGLSAPIASDNAAADDGWFYLNLLTSMAQLHTLNVTPDFIRRAVADFSSKFELSPDGTKVRWRGGTVCSRLSSDSESNSDVDKQRRTTLSSSANKCGPSGHATDTAILHDRQEPNTALPSSTYEPLADPGLATKRRPVFLEKTNNEADFQYKPLFFHGMPSNAGDGLDDSDSVASSELMETATGLNSGINSGSHGLRETEVKMRKQNAGNGPIIFYHKARFCTDLSGDPHGAVIDESAYHRFTQDPLGCPPEEPNDSEEKDEKYVSDTMELDFESTKANRSTLDLDDLESCISSCVSSTSPPNLEPIAMEMSGLGGIQPMDNFMVTVQVWHRNMRKEPSRISSDPVRNRPKPPSWEASRAVCVTQHLPRSEPMEMPIASEIIATAKKDMDPSQLPPPSYLCLPFSSSDSEEEEYDEDDGAPMIPYNDVLRSPGQVVDPFAPRTTKPSFGSSSDETKESSYAPTPAGADHDDDDSIDLLAHARILDPDTIAAQERDFEDNVVSSEDISAIGGESHAKPIQSVHIDDSDVDSMSVGKDSRSRMDDSA